MDTDSGLVVTRGKAGGGGRRGKGVKYLVMEGNPTLGGEYTMQYIYGILLNYTLEG